MNRLSFTVTSIASSLACMCGTICYAPQAFPAEAYSHTVAQRYIHEQHNFSAQRRSSENTGSQEYTWPTGSVSRILTPYAPGKHNWNRGHRGVDLAIAYGGPVYAAGTGRVIYAGTLNDREVISIEHPSGIRTTYEPVHPHVHKGDFVLKGEEIGTINGYHCAHRTPCLHWGAKRGSSGYLNPLWLIDMPHIRLLE